ncbi:MAG TPA: transcription elongation factor GreA, partial [Exiguobacterium sp.]|nr:transcription elongation factor GreA [Exiguobacterium sp.]
MAEKQYYMTLEGKANIENELNELKSV